MAVGTLFSYYSSAVRTWVIFLSVPLPCGLEAMSDLALAESAVSVLLGVVSLPSGSLNCLLAFAARLVYTLYCADMDPLRFQMDIVMI